MKTYRDYSKEEVARLGRDIYDVSVRPDIVASDKGKYVTIDVETGEWRMGDNISNLAAELHAKRPEAPLFTLRVGYAATARIGSRVMAAEP